MDPLTMRDTMAVIDSAWKQLDAHGVFNAVALGDALLEEDWIADYSDIPTMTAAGAQMGLIPIVTFLPTAEARAVLADDLSMTTVPATKGGDGA